MTGQMSIFDWMPTALPQPPWIECFRQCQHFDTHPDYLPDFFPATKVRRCNWCDHKGTSGEQFWFENRNGVQEMFCRFFERRRA